MTARNNEPTQRLINQTIELAQFRTFAAQAHMEGFVVSLSREMDLAGIDTNTRREILTRLGNEAMREAALDTPS